MHLLAAQAGAIDDGTEAVDLGQSPADLVVLSAADTEIAALADAHARAPSGLSLRLASLMHLRHPMSVDLHLDTCATRSRLVVARVLGGRGYWPYGVEQYAARLHEAGVPLALLPGDDRPDPELRDLSTVSGADYDALWAYLVEGGPENAAGLLAYAAHMLDGAPEPPAARAVLRAGLHWPGLAAPSLEVVRARWPEGAPVVPVAFYRALLLGAGTEPVDRLVEALLARGMAPLPVFVASLKDPLSVATLHGLMERAAPDVILNATAFSSGTGEAPGGPLAAEPANGAPVLQVVLVGLVGGSLGGGDGRARRTRRGDERGAAGDGRADPRARRLLQGRGAVGRGDAVLGRRAPRAARPGGVRGRPRRGLGAAQAHARGRAAGGRGAGQLPQPRRAARQRRGPRHARRDGRRAAAAGGGGPPRRGRARGRGRADGAADGRTDELARGPGGARGRRVAPAVGV